MADFTDILTSERKILAELTTMSSFVGGPLHLGDIEELPDSTECPCIVCPWHKWSFKLSNGKLVSPPERNLCINVYPVRTTESGQIQIGFSRINPIYFNSDCDF